MNFNPRHSKEVNLAQNIELEEAKHLLGAIPWKVFVSFLLEEPPLIQAFVHYSSSLEKC